MSQAQWSYKFMSQEKHFFYGSGEYVMGKCNGGNVGLNYVYNSKYTVRVGYSATNKSACSLPANYLKSATELIPLNNAEPFQNLENLHLLFGRAFNLNKSNSIRFVFQGGPGLSTFREPDFTISGREYDYDMKSTQKICLVLNPKIELPLCCTIGCSVGPMLVMNNSQTYIGAGIGIMYGIIGKGKG